MEDKNEVEALLAAKEALNEGSFQKVIKIIKDNNLNDIMSQVLLADSYLMLGEFVIAVDNYIRITNTYSRNNLDKDEYKYLEKAQQAVDFYENIGFHEYDLYLEGKDIVQSVERSNESYPESDYYQAITNCKDENIRNKMIEDLFSQEVLSNPEEKEASYFSIAEFYFGSDNNDDSLKAFAYYYQAIKLNPNKALYYGYAANSLYKYIIKKQITGEVEDELVYMLCYRSSKLAKRAIELDPKNARWYFYQQLALSSLIVHNANFIRQAIKDNEIAFSLCRSDQRALKEAILKSSDTLNNAKELLETAGALTLEKPEENQEVTTDNLQETQESTQDIYMGDDLKEFSDTEEMKSVRLIMYDRNFEQAIEILKDSDENNFKERYMLAESYYYSGEFDRAYDVYKNITMNFVALDLKRSQGHYLKKANEMKRFFEDYGYTASYYNVKKTDQVAMQSIERDDGSYKESDEALACRTGGPGRKNSIYQNIVANLDSSELALKERANFSGGEVLYHSERDYEGAFGMYLSAAKIAPNKALYFGYASNAMYRCMFELLNNKEAKITLPLLASKFAKRAIDLDFNNPRWHLFQSKALSFLVGHEKNFIFQAEKENEMALTLCRHDQSRLRKEILSNKEDLEDTKSRIKESELIFYEQSKMEEKRKNQIKKRIERYWARHSHEKSILGKEIQDIKSKLEQHNNEISILSNNSNRKELRQQIIELENQSSKVVFFKIKRNRITNEEIESLKNKISEIDRHIKDDVSNINKEINLLEKRLKEIERQLTKER